MKVLVMIPARYGNKTIPKKNFRLLNGKPLLRYAIELSKNCSIINEFFVNTESEIVADLARNLGAKVHIRPHDLSNDFALSDDFSKEFLSKHTCDFLVMLNPTSPLISVDTLNDFIGELIHGDCDTLLSVVEEKTEFVYDGKEVNFDFKLKKRSRELTPVLKLTWAITGWKTSSLLSKAGGGKGVFAGKVGYFSIPKDESFTLNSPEDWDISESILKVRAHKV
ncbi:MAG: CMP-N-acetylneuraminic acid synthetase [Bacteriovoracaceae bacterium]|jgi:CMP-N-acetylneuraminic acid synthetase